MIDVPKVLKYALTNFFNGIDYLYCGEGSFCWNIKILSARRHYARRGFGWVRADNLAHGHSTDGIQMGV